MRHWTEAGSGSEVKKVEELGTCEAFTMPKTSLLDLRHVATGEVRLYTLPGLPPRAPRWVDSWPESYSRLLAGWWSNRGIARSSVTASEKGRALLDLSGVLLDLD